MKVITLATDEILSGKKRVKGEVVVVLDSFNQSKIDKVIQENIEEKNGINQAE